mgnify:CR=1 FL=1
MELKEYTYKFRLYPNKEQEIKLAKHFGCVRWCYNHFLDKRVKYYLESKEKNLKKKSLNYNDDAKALTEIKKKEATKWLNEVNAQSLQHALKHLESGFNRFFNKLSKFPNFKKKNNKQSFRVPQNIKIKNNKLYITKFMEGIEIRLHRKIEGEIRNATVTKNCAGQYHVSIGVQREIKKLKPNNKVIGIDLGIKTLITCSDGTIYENIKPYRNLESRRRILAKNLSRTVKGSKGREKARRKLAKLDNYICNVRKDHLHKVSHKIVSENQTIIIENLNVSGMLKNRKLSKSIWDCSFSELVRQISYKSNWYGKELIQVSRWFPSSKTCSNCFYINDNLTLADREWNCPKCEIKHDRDLNAAINIKRQGLNQLNRGNHGDSCLS